jgi:hypothetical protein
MWVKIAKEIFEKSEFKNLNFLYQILSWYPDESSIRYNVFIDTEEVKNTENFKKISFIEKSLEAFLNDEYNYFFTSGSSISYNIAYRKAPNNFNIEEAILFFNQPISIVLENNKNDSQFIKAIITHFGKIDRVNKAEEHLNNGWIHFENAGGCSNIPNFIGEFLERFKQIADKNNRQTSDYFRGVIIIDSDREYEGQPSKHDALLKKLDLLGIDSSLIYILEKRMMENYLPTEVFQEIQRQHVVQQSTDLKNWLEAYLTLIDKKQLDYINIPEGKLYGNSHTPELMNLWGNLGGNFMKLDKGFKFQGFNKGILKTAGEASFKNEMPSWFKKSFITKQNLEARDGNGELQRIANKITSLL